MAEAILSIPDITPSPDFAQHSDGTYVDPLVSARQVERLSGIVQTWRKPIRIIDVDHQIPDITGRKSLDQICIQEVARGFSTNAKKDNLDAVDLLASTLGERIVKIKPGVDGAPVRGGSAHGVTFLQVCVQSGECMNAAVKAFGDPNKAFAEYVNTQIIATRGISTLEPLAVVIDNGHDTEGHLRGRNNGLIKEPIGYYMSRMEPIRSMDRLRIIKQGYISLMSGDEDSKEYLTYINKIGETLAQMQLNGIFPGDSQLKNFAIRNDGSVIPIDFENVDIFNENFYETNPEKFVDLSVKGLRVLFDSLNGQKSPSINFFGGLSGENLWKAFEEVIFNSYGQTFENYLLGVDAIGKVTTVDFLAKIDLLWQARSEIRTRIREYIMTPTNGNNNKKMAGK